MIYDLKAEGRDVRTRATRANRATSPRCPASGNKANSRPRGSGGRSIAPNKPNFKQLGRRPRRDSAKQTQFGPVGPALAGRLCETKPNLRGLGQVGKEGHGMWAGFAGKWNARNKPNSRPTRYPTIPLSIIPDRRQPCKTKPISAPAAERDASFCFIHPPAAATLGVSVCIFTFLVWS
jgi:hypothetical protein